MSFATPSNSKRRFWRKPHASFWVMLAMVGWLVGCATETKQKWLIFFFDGVPQPGSETNHVPAEVTAAVQPANAAPAAVITKVKVITHPPYEKEECTKCHESAFSQAMRGKPGEACFACHKNLPITVKEKHAPFENGECASCHEPHQGTIPKLLKKKPDVLCADCHDIPDKKSKAVHQPVSNGECLSCHDPHGTDVKKLLLKPDGKLCFECHEDVQQNLAKAKVKHQPVENGECSSCHNAHQSDQKKLLAKDIGKLCYDCHDDLQKTIANAPFKHDPAVNGECASCHVAHQSNEPKLLAKERGKLCLDCHEEPDLAKVAAHKQTTAIACTVCHDPHAGKDKYFLTPRGLEARPAGAGRGAK